MLSVTDGSLKENLINTERVLINEKKDYEEAINILKEMSNKELIKSIGKVKVQYILSSRSIQNDK